MTISRLARTAAVGGAATLLTLTAACGSSSSGSGSDGGSSGSSSSGSDQNAAALTKSNIFSQLIAAQKQAGSYTFGLKLNAAGMSSTGSGKADTSGDKPATEATLTALGQKIQTIAVDGLLYVKGTGLGTDKWVKIDPSDKSGPGSLFSGSTDPAQQLSALADAAKVTKAGTEQVDGVDTTEYDVTVPGSALAKSNPTLKQLASALPKTIEYDLFVDKDNLLRKLDNELTVQGQKVSTEVTFADYGKDVSIEAPPAGQTTTKFNFGGLGGATKS